MRSATYSWQSWSLEVESQPWLWGVGPLFRAGTLSRSTWRRHLKVLIVVDIGAARTWIKGWDEGRELALENKFVVPGAPACASGVIFIFLLYQHGVKVR